MEKRLTKNWHLENSHTLEVYRSQGGYSSLSKLFSMDPKEVIEQVKASGVRGRGGAGFPAGLKWSFVPQNTGKPNYLAVNADESEPGTFKDRFIIENDPHMMLEGIIACCYAVNIHTAYIYIRGEFVKQAKILEAAIAEAYAAGFLGEKVAGHDFKLDVYVHRGAGAYICGEETALLESLEGKRGHPRLKPPFPAVEGLFACPTVINNVETLASLPYIFENGVESYRKIGTEKSPGTKLFSVSGHVNKPGVYEVPLGYSMKQFIMEDCGGISGGKALKAVIPGGSSVPVLTADEIENVTLDYESIAAAGSMLGSGGMIVLNEDVNMVEALGNLAHFYTHESCGQCTPCREGTGWSKKILDRILGGEGRQDDLQQLLNIADNMAGKTICALADALAMPINSYIKKFRHEFEAKIEGNK